MRITRGHWLKGMMLSLVDEDCSFLPEYPSPTTWHAATGAYSKSIYVLCKRGRGFAIHLLRPYPSGPAIRYSIKVDGRLIGYYILEESYDEGLVTSFNLPGPRGAIHQRFKFGDLLPSPDQALDPAILDDLGRITITLEAGLSLRLGGSGTWITPNLTLGSKAGKLLTTYVTGDTLGPAQPAPVATFQPFANAAKWSIIFIYREYAALELIGVIPLASLSGTWPLVDVPHGESDVRLKIKPDHVVKPKIEPGCDSKPKVEPDCKFDVKSKTEYPPEDPSPEDNCVSKYIECQNGVRFKLEFTRLDKFDHAIKILILVDGRKVYGSIIETHTPRKSISDFTERDAGGTARRKAFAFGTDPSEDGPRLGPTQVDLEQLGTINVTFEAGVSCNVRTFSVDNGLEPLAVGGQEAKKLLSSFIIGEEIGGPQLRPDCYFVPYLDGPKLMTSFMYRTEEVLRMIGVKPPILEPPILEPPILEPPPFSIEDVKPKLESRKRKMVEADGAKKKSTRVAIDLTREDGGS
ncbi:hypothetical protein CcaverHIS631_0410320 [Cutaneotrichosporon cavernicola]|nr:hypothetical protein CcaverHIS631_0410320 [Cutaneotrichosporon cavernicola]BEJ07762.1 hypothetical protein CcaverHIS641_0410310 [Cutaneotrichosporon cavernicola]